MSKPGQRVSSLKPADRAPGLVRNGLAASAALASARPAPAPTPEPAQPAPENPAAQPAPPAPAVPATQDAPRPKPARTAPRSVPAAAAEEGASGWAGVALPTIAAPDAVFDKADLVAGPVRPYAVLLPAEVASALKAVKLQRSRDGYRVTLSALVTHSLAYAYTKPAEWLDLVPADGRRKDGSTNLSATGGRTSFVLPVALDAATDALLWRASAERPDSAAPAKLNLQATAIAWGLSRYADWIDDVDR